MPEWLVWILGPTGGGAVVAALLKAWSWYKKERDQAQAKVGKSWKSLFEEMKAQLTLLQEGMTVIQKEHTECMIEGAKTEAENEFLKAENAQLKAQLNEKTKPGGS